MSATDKLNEFLAAGVSEITQDEPRNFLASKKPETAPIAPDSKSETNKNLPANLAVKLPNKSALEQQVRKSLENINDLQALEQEVKNFSGCALKNTAQNTVFADGVATSEILLIGEAPGASEDEQGIPFCGISGKLLDDIFRAIGHKRSENLYITNSVFWRPPGNRRPTDEEIALCRPFVEKHIALKKPKLIVLVGSTALASLLPHITATISKIRGSFLKYDNPYLEQEIDITAIFHPSYLLRQPAKKQVMWQDMVKIKQFLNN